MRNFHPGLSFWLEETLASFLTMSILICRYQFFFLFFLLTILFSIILFIARFCAYILWYFPVTLFSLVQIPLFATVSQGLCCLSTIIALCSLIAHLCSVISSTFLWNFDGSALLFSILSSSFCKVSALFYIILALALTNKISPLSQYILLDCLLFSFFNQQAAFCSKPPFVDTSTTSGFIHCYLKTNNSFCLTYEIFRSAPSTLQSLPLMITCLLLDMCCHMPPHFVIKHFFCHFFFY